MKIGKISIENTLIFKMLAGCGKSYKNMTTTSGLQRRGHKELL